MAGEKMWGETLLPGRSHFEAARIREASCRPDLQRGSDRNSAFLN
jgi:hypothetical protein